VTEAPVPAAALPNRPAGELLDLARTGLAEAATIPTPGMRYATAHLAALRAAAAVLAARATPAPAGRRGPIPNVWATVALVAPELTEWAAYFAASSAGRASVEAGIPTVVTAAEADDMIRAAEHFVALAAVLVSR
jgi:hypothetical protein